MAGFVANSGTNFGVGDTAEIAKRLNQLGKKLGVTIRGISGYRTPSHSVSVGGSANDPHTHGAAADIGVNSSLRDSAATLTNAQLASVGLYRPFPGVQEINHVQLLPAAKRTMQTNTANGGGVLEGIVRGAAGATGSVTGQLIGPAAGVGADVAGDVFAGPAAAIDKAVADKAAELAQGIVSDVWDSAEPKAEYAGLFLVLLAGGVWLAVTGLSRSTGLKEPAPA